AGGIAIRIRCGYVAGRTVNQYIVPFLRTSHGVTENTEEPKDPSVRSVSSCFVFGRDAITLIRAVRERVAAFDRAAVEATSQPPDSIVRRAVGEAFGNHLAARHALQSIVADRCCPVPAFLAFTRFEPA